MPPKKPPLPVRAPKEGLVTFSFNFNGKRYHESHQLADKEVEAIKAMCVEFGELSVNSVFIKQLFNGSKMLVEGVLSKAMVAYIKEHHKPKKSVNVFDIPADVEGEQK